MRSYREITDWLFQQFPSYQNLGAGAYKPDLENISKLLRALGNPEQKLRFIHIAGTNGKGSTSHMLSALCQQHGLKTGLFTSPHLVDFRERIKINGTYISEEAVVNWVEHRLPDLHLDYEPSFFELTFAMAVDYFHEEACDVCIIETGMGGRLDATNCITPLVSVITNIGLDHKQFLGETRLEIAGEKAGIIKKGVPVVICENDSETRTAFEEKAQKENAELHWVNSHEPIECDLIGSFQQQNAHTALKAFRLACPLLHIQPNPASIKRAFKNSKSLTGFLGRMEILSNEPLTILDGAHNREGVLALLHATKEFNKGRLYIIYGASSDKDIPEIVRLFPRDCVVSFTEFSHPRSAKYDQLKSSAVDLHQEVFFFKNPKEALASAQTIAGKNDTILIFGSLFLVAEFF
jgi:dihydrofolate synthase / folylpolyglutamate synthase